LAAPKLSARDLWRMRVLSETQSLRTGTFSVQRACSNDNGTTHLKQLALALDRAKWIAACCGRRGGKSTGLCARAIDVCMTIPNAQVYYCSKSYVWGKNTIITPILKPMLDAQGIAYREMDDKGELSFTFANGSKLFFLAADDLGDIKKFNGKKMHLCIVDEMQDLREEVLVEFLDVIVTFCLYDFDGTLVLAGIPSESPAGFWYDIWQNPQYSKHYFTAYDNPLRSREETDVWVAAECKRRGVTINHAIIQRSVFAVWVPMTEWLVYKYDKAKNEPGALFQKVDKFTPGWRFALGVDTGSADRFAISVLGQSMQKPQTHLADEWVTGRGADLDFTSAVNQMKAFRDKYGPSAYFFDPAHAGKPLMAELRNRHGFDFMESANKNQRKGQIELVNDELRRSNILIPSWTETAGDMVKTMWDKDKAKENVWEYSNRWHPDPSEAFRYGFNGIYPTWYVQPDRRPAQVRERDEEMARIEKTMQARHYGEVEADEVDESPSWARNPFARR
jgi:hypothetical protein